MKRGTLEYLFEKHQLLTLLVYFAMSAATSAEVVAIWKSVLTDVEGVLTVTGVVVMETAGVLVTRVIEDVDVL